MTKPKSLTDKIFDIITVSPTPMTAAEIKRALPDDVTDAEISSRLCKLKNRNFIFTGETERRALTGKSMIRCYSSNPVKVDNESHCQQGNIFPLLLQA